MPITKRSLIVIACLCSACLLVVLRTRFYQRGSSVANIEEKLSHSSKNEISLMDISSQLEKEEEGKWRLPPVQTRQPKVLDCRELLTLAEARFDQLKDFQVIFRRVEEKSDGQKAHLSRTTVVLKGYRIYIDHHYGVNPNSVGYKFRRVIAYNGKKTTLYEPRRAFANVEAGQNHETDTQRYDFFSLNLLNAPLNDRLGPGFQNSMKAVANSALGSGRGRDDQSLISMLRNSKTAVRPFLEKIGRRDCHVIDTDHCTVWLDAERGCVPLRQVYRDRRRPQFVIIQFQVRRVTEVSPGFWVATRGRKIVPKSEIIIYVEGWVNNEPAIKVNAGVPDEFFDLWKHLPPGTEVWMNLHSRTWNFVDQNTASR